MVSISGVVVGYLAKPPSKYQTAKVVVLLDMRYGILIGLLHVTVWQNMRMID